MARQPKTAGLEWLMLSLASFNGSGYADMYSADTFMDSYAAYKTMKKKPEAVAALEGYREAIKPSVEELLLTTRGAGRRPSRSNLKQFGKFYPPALNWIETEKPH